MGLNILVTCMYPSGVASCIGAILLDVVILVLGCVRQSPALASMAFLYLQIQVILKQLLVNSIVAACRFCKFLLAIRLRRHWA